eukprot:CAMPEP_0172444260 /NCGR_PEP_ID=MMETSP1065-20121228/4321_1 /TAXON_ID=265537 /ORGANISM="Amphiprora paludosa, Strain CCMP125" /LENGTH=355 /DNA_ID=CAMNT_0013194725 /DNA_START=260 /DNA_END=1327 /DNA_ORIENTATION=-
MKTPFHVLLTVATWLLLPACCHFLPVVEAFSLPIAGPPFSSLRHGRPSSLSSLSVARVGVDVRDPTSRRSSTRTAPHTQQRALKLFWQTLQASQKDITTEPCQIALELLHQTYVDTQVDARTSPWYDGDWIIETRPTFPGLLGYNEQGDALYTLGRLTFNMIPPHNLVCSVQKMTQHIHKLSQDPQHVHPHTGQVTLPPYIPTSLQEELTHDASELRSYRTDVHFTVEEHNGLQGVLQMEGYTVPNPHEPNRYSIWFTGGRCLARHDADADAWRHVFGSSLPPPLSIPQQLQLGVAQLLMGAQAASGLRPDGSLDYVMKRPMGGHRRAYQDVLYVDDTTRITAGNRGTVVVVSRL